MSVRLLSVVHKLRPADIKVVAALGDSSTVRVYIMLYIYNKCSTGNILIFFYHNIVYLCVLNGDIKHLAPTMNLLISVT